MRKLSEIGGRRLPFLRWSAVRMLLGALGVAIGISCRATAHHLGPWWIVETAGFAALTALSVACFAGRTRR